MKHLTDSQIQQFVFEPAASDNACSTHIEQCAICRSKVGEYQMLFAEIEKLPADSFDVNLEAIIMKQLPQPSIHKKEDKMLWYGIAAVCFLFVISVFLFFGKELAVLFGGVEWLTTALIGTAAICLLAFLAFDMYRAYRVKLKAFNFE
ncbi:hypothetical protein A3860_20055 [Niastella vici]|uniref:Zinc-finger domain-containing protein n=1 Tax=Niastella vici TaxID=1703345 RepID=A0A1V9G113_9BACT|nr:hypothetical protein [Niastella vici]OQP64272.1 hypothetical protein A3860_20055 [Niastella vici]